MPIPGFTDYSRTSAQNSAPFVNDNPLFGAGYSSAIFDTQGYEYVNVFFTSNPHTVGYKVFANFAPDSGLGLQVYDSVFSVGVGGTATSQVLAMARYAQIQVFQSSAAATDRIRVVAFGSNAQATLYQSGSVHGSVLSSFSNVAAGGTHTQSNIFPQSGDAAVTFWAANNANYFLQLQSAIDGVTFSDFAYFYGAHYGQAGVERIILPSSPLSMIVHNTDAAAQNIGFNIMTGS